jgi:hypothetical protein
MLSVIKRLVEGLKTKIIDILIIKIRINILVIQINFQDLEEMKAIQIMIKMMKMVIFNI